MADSALLTVGLLKGPMINEALDIVRKGGAVVMTAIASMADVTPTLPMAMMTLFQKRLLGSLYGEANPRADIPRLLNLYRDGKLLLDETVTSEYKLGRHQRGLRRHARRPQHPRSDHPQPLEALDYFTCYRRLTERHRQQVSFVKKQLTELCLTGWPEARLDARQCQCPAGRLFDIEDGSRHTPAAFDHKSGVQRETSFPGSGDPFANEALVETTAPPGGQVGAFQITIHFGVRQERQDHQA